MILIATSRPGNHLVVWKITDSRRRSLMIGRHQMREWRKLKRKEAAATSATLEIIGSAHTYYPIREIDSETGDDEVEAADTPIQHHPFVVVDRRNPYFN